MKAKPHILRDGAYLPCEAKEAEYVELQMEGHFPTRMIPVILKGSRDKCERKPVWSWNGDTERPTLKPSILTRGGPDSKYICHAWVNNGTAQYLSDSTHEFAGQTRDLLEIESEADDE